MYVAVLISLSVLFCFRNPSLRPARVDPAKPLPRAYGHRVVPGHPAL